MSKQQPAVIGQRRPVDEMRRHRKGTVSGENGSILPDGRLRSKNLPTTYVMLTKTMHSMSCYNRKPFRHLQTSSDSYGTFVGRKWSSQVIRG